MSGSLAGRYQCGLHCPPRDFLTQSMTSSREGWFHNKLCVFLKYPQRSVPCRLLTQQKPIGKDKARSLMTDGFADQSLAF